MINMTTTALAKKIVDHVLDEMPDYYLLATTPEAKKDMYDDCIKEVHGMIHEAVFGHSYLAFFDGSATPNPGMMKIGGYIQGPGTKKKRVAEYSEELGHGTNNEAEYLSLIRLLNELKRLGIWKVKIHGDSSLVINQVNGKFKTRDPRMRVFRNTAIDLLRDINEWSLVHVPRAQNKGADSLT
jgi:ribonuclease HI